MQRNTNPAEARNTCNLFAGGNIRKLLARERGQLRDHLLRLSPADRQLRSVGSVRADYIIAHTETLQSPGVTVPGYFVRGLLCAVDELHQQGTGRAAEVGISVEHPLQGHRHRHRIAAAPD